MVLNEFLWLFLLSCGLYLSPISFKSNSPLSIASETRKNHTKVQFPVEQKNSITFQLKSTSWTAIIFHVHLIIRKLNNKRKAKSLIKIFSPIILTRTKEGDEKNNNNDIRENFLLIFTIFIVEIILLLFILFVFKCDYDKVIFIVIIILI